MIRQAVVVAGFAVLAACTQQSAVSFPPASTCPTSYCASHGTCTEVDSLPTCACDPGYQGLDCSVCSPGYHRVGGSTCTLDEACDETVCNGHGTCSVVAGVAQCDCAAGYDGPRCGSCYGTFIDISDAGASAADAGDDAGAVAVPAVCIFPAGCTPTSCRPGFTCDDSSGVIACTCATGACATCTPGLCGQGTCDDSTGVVRCTCAPGYQGATCDACYFGYHAEDGGTCALDGQCTTTTCSGGGTCRVTGGVASCTCDPGFEGSNCQTCSTGYHPSGTGQCVADQACAANSCPATATCVVTRGVVGCQCNPGYAGSTCLLCAAGYHAVGASCVLDRTCQPTSCGQGTCEDATGAVVCSNCPAGFSGTYCEVNLNDCGTACATGQCLDLVGGRVCLCTDQTWGQSCLPGPTVSALTPSQGPMLGGTVVTITGTGFVAGTTVTFGGTAATSVVIDSPTTLHATAPAAALGAVDLVVLAPNAQRAHATFT